MSGFDRAAPIGSNGLGFALMQCPTGWLRSEVLSTLSCRSGGFPGREVVFLFPTPAHQALTTSTSSEEPVPASYVLNLPFHQCC